MQVCVLSFTCCVSFTLFSFFLKRKKKAPIRHFHTFFIYQASLCLNDHWYMLSEIKLIKRWRFTFLPAILLRLYITVSDICKNDCNAAMCLKRPPALYAPVTNFILNCLKVFSNITQLPLNELQSVRT